MYGCPHCKTWLHEECVQEEIKRKAYNKLFEEEGEETLRNLLSLMDIDSQPMPPTPKKSKKAPTTSNGKGKGPSTLKDVRNPTIEMLDKIFQVVITVSSQGQVTRALVRDIRPAEGQEEAEDEEVEVAKEDEEGEGEVEEDEEGAKKEKVKRKKARREWEEDVLCLLCKEAIY